MNYEKKKLTDINLVKIFIISNLCKWENLREIEEGIRSKKALQRELDLKSISYSQISRRLIDENTADIADLLGRLGRCFWVLQRHAQGINPKVGVLRIIDGTYVKLPDNASNWTAISKVSSGIKLHIRIAVASPDNSVLHRHFFNIQVSMKLKGELRDYIMSFFEHDMMEEFYPEEV